MPSIHPYRGQAGSRGERLALVAFLALLGIALLLLIFLPAEGRWLASLLQALEPLILLVALVGAGIANWRFARQRRRAGMALQAAAGDDPFWSAEGLRAQVETLFEPYWRAVVARDILPVADRLTPYWRSVLERGLARWRADDVRPVMFVLDMQGSQVVGLEDWRDNERDQVTVRVDARTAYHATDTRRGEVVEGTSGERIEQQLWQFVRGDAGWLLNRVDLVGSNAAYSDCRIYREMA